MNVNDIAYRLQTNHLSRRQLTVVPTAPAGTTAAGNAIGSVIPTTTKDPRRLETEFMMRIRPPGQRTVKWKAGATREGNTLALNWTAPGATLEWATNVLGPWTVLPIAEASVRVSPAEEAGFYRLRQ